MIHSGIKEVISLCLMPLLAKQLHILLFSGRMETRLLRGLRNIFRLNTKLRSCYHAAALSKKGEILKIGPETW